MRGPCYFIGLEAPEHVRTALTGLREEQRGFHWVRAENYHLTLKYLGPLAATQFETVSVMLETIAVERFILPVEGVGCFPGKGQPHTLWAGTGNAHPRLFQLHKRIEDGLLPVGFEPEKRILTPHFTLARTASASRESVRQFLKRHRDFAAAPFAVTAFHLFRSELIDGKRRYPIETTWPLRDQTRSGHED
ncbi:MAG: RNA 2',3'-cyclic phosphodiesterase [Opitutales bacterium]